MPHGKVLRVEKDGFGIVDIEGLDRLGFFSRERTTIVGPAARVSVGDVVAVDVIDTHKDLLVISEMAVESRPSVWHRVLEELHRLFSTHRSKETRSAVRARSE